MALKLGQQPYGKLHKRCAVGQNITKRLCSKTAKTPQKRGFSRGLESPKIGRVLPLCNMTKRFQHFE